jgi:hypothetical protein
MRNPTTFVLILIFAITVFGQVEEKNKDRAFEVPAKYLSVLLVKDPKCPIELTEPTKVIGWSNAGLSLGFNLQNVSKANVVSFDIEETDWFGSHGYNIPATVNENMFFLPLMTISADDWLGERTEDLVTFDEKTIGKEYLYPASKIWIAMVVKVKLSDGAVYDASKKYDELTKFLYHQFEEYRSGTIDLDQREQKLRTFVDNLMKSKN